MCRERAQGEQQPVTRVTWPATVAQRRACGGQCAAAFVFPRVRARSAEAARTRPVLLARGQLRVDSFCFPCHVIRPLVGPPPQQVVRRRCPPVALCRCTHKNIGSFVNGPTGGHFLAASSARERNKKRESLCIVCRECARSTARAFISALAGNLHFDNGRSVARFWPWMRSLLPLFSDRAAWLIWAPPLAPVPPRLRGPQVSAGSLGFFHGRFAIACA